MPILAGLGTVVPTLGRRSYGQCGYTLQAPGPGPAVLPAAGPHPNGSTRIQPNDTPVITRPTQVITAAEATGRSLKALLPVTLPAAGSMLPTHSTSTPMPISTTANPALKPTSSS